MSARAGSTRDSIVAAAVPVFGRYGYRKTSMDQLAQAAGVSRPAVYQYFPNKDAVFRAVAAAVGEQLHAAAEAAGRTGATTADRLCNVLGVKLDFAAGTVAADHRHELVQEAAAVAADLVAESEARYAALVAAVIEAAPELDLLGPAISAEDAAQILVDAMTGIARSAATAEQMHARLRQLVDLAVRGLTSRPPTKGTRP
jgi:TetR/AcrR family transcriptional regulator